MLQEEDEFCHLSEFIVAEHQVVERAGQGGKTVGPQSLDSWPDRQYSRKNFSQKIH